MKNILIFIPHMPFIFSWILAENLKLLIFLKNISKSQHNIILKFHPRHSKIELYKSFLNFDNFQIETRNNVQDLIKNCDLAIAFESSSVIFEVIFFQKPLIYVNDYITIFDNEKVYKKFLKKIVQMNFNDLNILFDSKINRINLVDLVPKIKKDQIFFHVGKISLNETVNSLKKLIR